MKSECQALPKVLIFFSSASFSTAMMSGYPSIGRT